MSSYFLYLLIVKIEIYYINDSETKFILYGEIKMVKATRNKDYNVYLTKLVKEGYMIKYGRKHQKLIHPSGNIVAVFPSSPSDGARGLKMLKSDVKKHS